MSPLAAQPIPRLRHQGPFGAARRLLDDPAPVLDEIRASGLPLVAMGRGPLRIVVVAEPGLVHQVLTMPTSRFRWSHPLNVLRFVVGDDSMLVSDGEDHRRRRGAVLPALARRRLDAFVPAMVAQADAVADDLLQHAGSAVALEPLSRHLAIRVVTEVLFGPPMLERAEELAALFERPQAYLEAPAVRQVPHRLPHTRRDRVRRDLAALAAIVDTEISARRAAPRDDLLSTMVVSGELDDREIRDQVLTLIGAGYNTTAASFCWLVWCATTEPEVWHELRAEADVAFASPSPDGLPGRLPFAANVVRETLRLHPAGLVAPRLAAEDVELGAWVIPRGAMVAPSPYLTGRDPRVWADPLRFDPHRFDHVTQEQRAAADRAWVPFGRGPRSCIGFALAQLELTIAATRLAQRLDLQPASAVVPSPTGLVVSRPKGGTRVEVHARRSSPSPSAPGTFGRGRAATAADSDTGRCPPSSTGKT